MARRSELPRLHLLSDQNATAEFYVQAIRHTVAVRVNRQFFDLGMFDKDPQRIVQLATARADLERDFFLVLFDGEEPGYFNDRRARSRQIRDHFVSRGVPERHIASWVVMPTTEALYLSTPELRDMVADYPRRSPPSRAELEQLGRTMRQTAPDKRRVAKAVLSGVKKGEARSRSR